jgi:hypothetical protein
LAPLLQQQQRHQQQQQQQHQSVDSDEVGCNSA